MDGIRSYYFDLLEQANRAEMQSDAFLKRFLSNIPGGKKLFLERKAEIKATMTDDEIHNFFKNIREKLQRRSAGGETSNPVIKTEPFAFPIQKNREESMDIPSWAQDLQKEIGEILNRIASSESSENECNPNQDIFAFNQKNNSRAKPSFTKLKCDICNKTGHTSQKCFHSVCGK